MENRGCDAEQTRALPAAALHQVSLLCARSSRSPSARVPTGAPRVHHPATPRPRRPARPRTLLFTSMVPRQPLLTPCRWPRFMLSAGPAAASTGAGPRERGQRGRGARARDSERRTAPRHRTCRGPRRAAPRRATLCRLLRGGPRVGLAVRQAGTRVPPREARGRRRPG